ncbi:hypothetical protein BGW80DRAFT_1252843 [Lactifluus volemus]|nr:hypothetical protein BGW80DRAFT_1252843 [Lactifluus volemus]
MYTDPQASHTARIQRGLTSILGRKKWWKGGPRFGNKLFEQREAHCALRKHNVVEMLSRKMSQNPNLSPRVGLPRRQPQRLVSPTNDNYDTITTSTPTPHSERHSHHRRDTIPSQMVLFRAAAPPILFAILIAVLLIELRARLASPLPHSTPLPLGVDVSIHGNTSMQRALIWAEARWPGLWIVLPLACAGTLGALRVVIWVCFTVLSRLEGQVNSSDFARVRIGRWEDGSSVSGSELLTGMFT